MSGSTVFKIARNGWFCPGVVGLKNRGRCLVQASYNGKPIAVDAEHQLRGPNLPVSSYSLARWKQEPTGVLNELRGRPINI